MSNFQTNYQIGIENTKNRKRKLIYKKEISVNETLAKKI